jgi:hypothetical protein
MAQGKYRFQRLVSEIEAVVRGAASSTVTIFALILPYIAVALRPRFIASWKYVRCLVFPFFISTV